jgi:6-phospho-beta-glucosidase
MKLAVVGGGSTYTPELVDGIGRDHAALGIEEVALVDPDEQRLAVVAGMSERILRRWGAPVALSAGPDLERGVDGAAAVIVQLRVGGQRARAVDETMPLECGCVGQETVGAGGLAKALRTIPLVLDIAETVAKSADDAWVVDFTNPVGMVTRALLDAGHRAVGLCNVAIGFQRHFAELLGVEPSRVELGHVGLNHLTWERSAVVDGVDRLPELIDAHAAAFAAPALAPEREIRRLGAVPSYYLRYYHSHDEVVAEQRHNPSRADEVAAIEAELLATYADPSVDTKPALLGRRGGAYYSEAALELLSALYGSDPATRVVDVRNDGLLPYLPDESVVEVPCQVSSTGLRALPAPPLPPELRGLVAHVAAYEELAVQAAVHGGRDRVATALLAHPLIGQYAPAERLADRIVAENRSFLSWAS